MKTFGSLVFLGLPWWWAGLIGCCILLPLTWMAWKPVRPMGWRNWIPLSLRWLGILLLLAFLLEPHWISLRPTRGANIVAVVADNSQGLQLKEVGQSKSRGEEMKDWLNGPDHSWLARLEDTFQVRPYRFDRDLSRLSNFNQLDFRGDRSNLGRTLQSMQDRFQKLPLAGIILLTDGNATDLEEGLPELPGLPPVYPVVVGNPGRIPDLSLDRIELRQTSFDDAPVTLKAEVSWRGNLRRQVEVAVDALEDPAIDTQLPDPIQLSLGPSGKSQAVTFQWRPMQSGLQFLEASVEPLEWVEDTGEATELNNRRLFMLDRGQTEYRILYVSGRPNWEYKFLNRALAEDPQLHMVGLIRVARREPKFEFKGRAGESSNPLFRGFGEEDETERYDQPVLVRLNTRDQEELREGFPQTAEDLFKYDGVILDDVEAEFFTFKQLDLLRKFASLRGGGLILLGGADALNAGGYADTPLAGALPVHIDRPAKAPPSEDLRWRLTREGWVEPWMRIRSLETEERARLNAMPPFQVLNPLHSIKPGASVLAEVEDRSGKRFPGLAAHPFGAGRVACLTVGDIWRWGLRDENDQEDLARFWRQMARWLVTDTPRQVSLEAKLKGENIALEVVAWDAAYQKAELAQARLTISRVIELDEATEEQGFSQVSFQVEPVSGEPGRFATTFTPRDGGAYLAEVEVTDGDGAVIGRAEAGWVTDPAGEEFRSLDPNRAILEELALRTGGQVLGLADLDGVSDLLSRQPAPFTETWTRPLWHRNWLFLGILGCFLVEWAVRRLRGLP